MMVKCQQSQSQEDIKSLQKEIEELNKDLAYIGSQRDALTYMVKDGYREIDKLTDMLRRACAKWDDDHPCNKIDEDIQEWWDKQDKPKDTNPL